MSVTGCNCKAVADRDDVLQVNQANMTQVLADRKLPTAWISVLVSMMAAPAQACVGRNTHTSCSHDMLAPVHAQHGVSALTTRPPATP